MDLDFFHQEGLDLSALEEPITEDEVWETIKSLPADKATGPDGYTGRFFKACWPITKADFMAAVITLQQGDARKLWLLKKLCLLKILKKKKKFCLLNVDPKKDRGSSGNGLQTHQLSPQFRETGYKVLANRLATWLKDLVANSPPTRVRLCEVGAFMTILC